MRFHLDLDTGTGPAAIQHRQKLLLTGSCFTEHIGQRLSDLKFDCHANPFGIVFNPESIRLALTRLLENRPFGESGLMERQGSWFSLETHTSFTKASKEELLATLNSLVAAWHGYLRTADWLILSFGSAFYYEHRELQRVVANCHKLPAKQFTKLMADPSAIIASYNELLKSLRSLNPDLKVMLTVSPVKHLRDGVVENNLSKAVLTVAAHGIANANEHCYYFPAYELVNDDLRDYRFYEADMAHPNQQAIDYVWQKFSGSWIDPAARPLLDRLAALQAAFRHRPLQEATQAFADFKSAQLKKCRELKTEFPYLDLNKEIIYFSQE
jgi:hypothetical protein